MREEKLAIIWIGRGSEEGAVGAVGEKAIAPMRYIYCLLDCSDEIYILFIGLLR